MKHSSEKLMELNIHLNETGDQEPWHSIPQHMIYVCKPYANVLNDTNTIELNSTNFSAQHILMVARSFVTQPRTFSIH